MRQFIVALSVILMGASIADARDEPLPDRVTQASRAYSAALVSQDLPAMSAAAEDFFAVAREFDLPLDDQVSIGLTALALASSRGRGGGLVELTRDTAAVADSAGDLDAVINAWVRGALAARHSNNFVAFDVIYAQVLNVTVQNHVRDEDWLAIIAQIPDPRSSPAARPNADPAAGVLELERARDEGDAIALANAVIGLQHEAMAREDWPRALELTQVALVDLAPFGVAGRPARDAVAVALSDILRDGFASTDSGESHLSGEARLAWCDYLTRQPVALDYITETPVPMRAFEYGEQGVVRTGFVVPAAGGAAQPGESRASTGGLNALRNASRNHLAQTHFRPSCAGQALPVSGVLHEGFVVVSERARGQRVLVAMAVFSAFSE